MSCSTRPPNFLLRKQKSLICEPVNQQPSIIRDRRIRFQKQYSADQSTIARDCNGIGLNNRRTNNLSYQTKSKSSNIIGTWNHGPSPESSLRIFTAFKNKNYVNGIENVKGKCVSSIFLYIYSSHN